MNKDSNITIDNQFNNNDANKHLNPLFPPNIIKNLLQKIIQCNSFFFNTFQAI